MHLVYVDDSKDEKLSCFSAIIIPALRWNEALEHLIAFRRAIKASHGIYSTIELHATDWLGGRGNVAPQTVLRSERALLFQDALRHYISLPECSILNGVAPRSADTQLFERLINRIQINMASRNSQAIIISDEGKSYDHLIRRMRRFNPIVGRFGGVLDRRIDRVIEDIVYRKSDRSLFIQAADFCAFSLLRMENPTPAIQRHGLAEAFMILEPVLEKRAFAKDHRQLGIIRV